MTALPAEEIFHVLAPYDCRRQAPPASFSGFQQGSGNNLVQATFPFVRHYSTVLPDRAAGRVGRNFDCQVAPHISFYLCPGALFCCSGKVWELLWWEMSSLADSLGGAREGQIDVL